MSQDLVTYCGLYGGSCARWHEYTVFRDLAKILAEWVDAQGYQYWLPTAVKDFDYTEFRKTLEFFSKDDSWLVCKKCCQGGDGNPLCKIRQCCQEKKLDLCFDCAEFPCQMAREFPYQMLERAQEYKELGKEKWLQRQIQKAQQGFELHTGKYYQIKVSKDPIE